MELSTIRRNNKTFRVFEKKKDISFNPSHNFSSRRFRGGSSSLFTLSTFIFFLLILMMITFWISFVLTNDPKPPLSSQSSSSEFLYSSEPSLAYPKSKLENLSLKKVMIPSEKEWEVSLSSSCQNVKHELSFCDSNGFCCALSQTNRSSGCCLMVPASSVLQKRIVLSPQFHTHRGFPSESPYSCTQCDPESFCCSEYHSCVSCCQHPLHRQYAHSLHLKESHYASFALKDVTHFDWCAFICRPSSISLSDSENSYRSPFNSCFLSHGPPVVFTSVNSDRHQPHHQQLQEFAKGQEAGSAKRPKYRYLRSSILHDRKISRS
jgi:hypothetical protein